MANPVVLNHLISYQQVVSSITKLADTLNDDFADTLVNDNIVALTLMNGGLVFAGQLLPHLKFPLKVDSLCVSRYRESAKGTDLQWHARPEIGLEGAHVLLLDDIYDLGVTLAHVEKWCLGEGAKRVTSVVLALKELSDANAARGRPDYFALTVPDKFVVGMGMDYAGLYRNAQGIFELQFEREQV